MPLLPINPATNQIALLSPNFAEIGPAQPQLVVNIYLMYHLLIIKSFIIIVVANLIKNGSFLCLHMTIKREPSNRNLPIGNHIFNLWKFNGMTFNTKPVYVNTFTRSIRKDRFVFHNYLLYQKNVRYPEFTTRQNNYPNGISLTFGQLDQFVFYNNNTQFTKPLYYFNATQNETNWNKNITFLCVKKQRFKGGKYNYLTILGGIIIIILLVDILKITIYLC